MNLLRWVADIGTVIGVVISSADTASEHIGHHLLDLADWDVTIDDSRSASAGGGRVYRTTGFELRTVSTLHIHLENAGDLFEDPTFIVFASRHSGDSGPLLTGHFTGNIGQTNEFGGEPLTVAMAAPAAHHQLIRSLATFAPPEYNVGVECTHHGPSEVGYPSLFAELGSGPDQWEDPSAARAVARAILSLKGSQPHQAKQLVGFGGGHYAPRFERIVRETNWAVGHIAADWALTDLHEHEALESVVDQLFEKSESRIAVIDRENRLIQRAIEKLGYTVVSETWVRETSALSLSLVETVETRLGHVDDGTRFGITAADWTGEFEIYELPAKLVDLATTVDRTATLDAAHRRCIAYSTAEGATRFTGRIAVTDDEVHNRMVSDMLDLLAEKFTIERKNDQVTLTERSFDPEKAAQLGVTEGPAFGQLANGESIEVDDRLIDPEDVHSVRKHIISLK